MRAASEFQSPTQKPPRKLISCNGCPPRRETGQRSGFQRTLNFSLIFSRTITRLRWMVSRSGVAAAVSAAEGCSLRGSTVITEGGKDPYLDISSEQVSGFLGEQSDESRRHHQAFGIRIP